MALKLTKEQFIAKARQVHGDKYDYSKVEYLNNSTKVCIICKEHGSFWQIPSKHLNGQGCPSCGGSAKLTKSKFIERAKQIHRDKYDYSKVEYININTKVCIICPIHGEFWQTPNKHLNGQGCKTCGAIKANSSKKILIQDFIVRSKLVHGDKYDYSKVEYVNANTKVCIICPIHGEFWQTPYNHLKGHGCNLCAIDFKSKLFSFKVDQFIERAKQIHGDKYDYSKVEYINTDTKVCIICPIHGEFWQTPYKHLIGQGCPSCNQSKLENEINDLLKAKNIEFIHNKFYDFLENLQLDFYIPQYNIAIECQGEQHFKAIDYFGGKDKFSKQQERDLLKKQLCQEHGIKLLYYSNKKWNDEIFIDKDLLLEEILKDNGN